MKCCPVDVEEQKTVGGESFSKKRVASQEYKIVLRRDFFTQSSGLIR